MKQRTAQKVLRQTMLGIERGRKTHHRLSTLRCAARTCKRRFRHMAARHVVESLKNPATKIYFTAGFRQPLTLARRVTPDCERFAAAPPQHKGLSAPA